MSLPQLIQDFSDEFDKVCEQRHLEGQKKYGEFSFLEKDMIQECINEITDASNYLRYMFIKLRMLQVGIAMDPRVEALANAEGDITLGVDSFHPNA